MATSKNIMSFFKSKGAIIVLMIIVGICLFILFKEYNSINRSCVETIDYSFDIGDSTLVRVDSLRIKVDFAYKSDFSIDESESAQTAELLKSDRNRAMEAGFRIRIDYNVFPMPIMLSSANETYISPRMRIDDEIIDNYSYSIDTCQHGSLDYYRQYNTMQQRILTNQVLNKQLGAMVHQPTGYVVASTGGKTRAFRSIDPYAQSNVSQNILESGYLLCYEENLIYDLYTKRGYKVTGPCFKSPEYKRHDALDTGWLGIREQSSYNIQICNLTIPECEDCTLSICFPSATYFEESFPKADYRDANTIVFSRKSSIDVIKAQGLFIHAKPYSNENIINTRNFLIASIIGCLISIFVNLIFKLFDKNNRC